MEDDRICQFLDQPVIPDDTFEYTEALRAQCVPIIIDNGNWRHCCHIT